MLQLHQIWRQYLRRFAVDHWYRFAKQRLHWTLPKLSTREQCDRWSDLMPLLTWQLWLAREIIIDNPLPWQKPITNLTLLLSCAVNVWSFRGDWYTATFLLNAVESLLIGQRGNPAPVEFVIRLSKKVQLNQQNNTHSRLDPLTNHL